MDIVDVYKLNGDLQDTYISIYVTVFLVDRQMSNV